MEDCAGDESSNSCYTEINVECLAKSQPRFNRMDCASTSNLARSLIGRRNPDKI